MSVEAIEAVRCAAPALRSALLEQPVKHRPSYSTAMLVARELADRHRVERGYVDESVAQIAESTGLTNGQVRDALAALDLAGCWLRITSGNRHRAARRIPGPLLNLDRRIGRSRARGSPAPQELLERGVEDLERGVAPATARGSPAHPHPPSSPRALVRRASHEVDQVVARLAALYSEGTVAGLVEELLAERFEVEWPSELEKHMDRVLAERRRAAREAPRTSAEERWEPFNGERDAPFARPRAS